MAREGTLTAILDVLLPEGLADRYESLGARRASLGLLTTLATAVETGAFIGLGGALTGIVTVAGRALPYGVTRLLAGLVFCLGLVPVVTMGAELFACNNPTVMAFVGGKITLARLLRSWGLVYAGNAVGAVATAVAVLVALHGGEAYEALGANALGVASGKCSLGFVQAVALGVMGNALVCLAVWLCLGARSTGDKVLAIVFPVTALVAAGFEHSIANMYFIPVALLIRWFDAAFVARAGVSVANLTLGNYLLANLLPVTIGNVLGGPAMVGLAYWLIYLRPKKARAMDG